MLQKELSLPFENRRAWGDWFWWSHDGDRLTALHTQGPRNIQLITWDLKKNTSREVKGFIDEVGSADCSPDGKLCLIGFESGQWEIKRLDQDDAQPLITWAHLHGMVRSAAFSSDGQRFSTGGWDAMILIWSADGALRQSLSGHITPVHVLKWSADDQRLISIARDQSMRVWSLKTGRADLTFERSPHGGLLVTTADGRLLGPTEVQINEDFSFLIERADGGMEVIDYEQFLRRTRGPKR